MTYGNNNDAKQSHYVQFDIMLILKKNNNKMGTSLMNDDTLLAE